MICVGSLGTAPTKPMHPPHSAHTAACGRIPCHIPSPPAAPASPAPSHAAAKPSPEATLPTYLHRHPLQHHLAILDPPISPYPWPTPRTPTTWLLPPTAAVIDLTPAGAQPPSPHPSSATYLTALLASRSPARSTAPTTSASPPGTPHVRASARVPGRPQHRQDLISSRTLPTSPPSWPSPALRRTPLPDLTSTSTIHLDAEHSPHQPHTSGPSNLRDPQPIPQHTHHQRMLPPNARTAAPRPPARPCTICKIWPLPAPYHR